MINVIDGGVCAAKGFKAAGIHCGIRKNKDKKDLALIVSEVPAVTAAVYTKNLVKCSPIVITKKHLNDGRAQAVICNSGIANACVADGLEKAEEMCAIVEKATGIKKENVVVASTGVIGMSLDTAPIAAGIGKLKAALGDTPEHSVMAANAIMTTDTKLKTYAVSFSAGGKTCKIGGIAKGSGMIHPNMATMLVFVTTDADIAPVCLQKALSEDVRDTFNMVSVDGDTSTNDMVTVLANGMAGNEQIVCGSGDYEEFTKALHEVTAHLCRAIAKDGEGASKLLECRVSGADSRENARMAAKSVICSSLTKAAMFGADANWGRVICALGYGGADIDPEKVDIGFQSAAGSIEVCKAGAGLDFSEELAKKILTEDEIIINVGLNMGVESATAYGCDLTYEYVKINGDYRS